jgi:hypothetical protein
MEAQQPSLSPLDVYWRVDQTSVLSMSGIVNIDAIFDRSERLKQAPDRPGGDESKADVIGLGVLARDSQHGDALGAEEIYFAEVYDEQAASAGVKLAVEDCAEPWCACTVDLAPDPDDDHALVTLVWRHSERTAQLFSAPRCLSFGPLIKTTPSQ